MQEINKITQKYIKNQPSNLRNKVFPKSSPKNIILRISSIKNIEIAIFLFLLENCHTFAEYSITWSRSGLVR